MHGFLQIMELCIATIFISHWYQGLRKANHIFYCRNKRVHIYKIHSTESTQVMLINSVHFHVNKIGCSCYFLFLLHWLLGFPYAVRVFQYGTVEHASLIRNILNRSQPNFHTLYVLLQDMNICTCYFIFLSKRFLVCTKQS